LHDHLVSVREYAHIHCILAMRPQPRSTLFPYTTLFRSIGPGPQLAQSRAEREHRRHRAVADARIDVELAFIDLHADVLAGIVERSEEHTSELQSRENLVCRLLLEKKKYIIHHIIPISHV